MDALKILSFPIAALVIGAAFLLLGLIGKVTASNVAFELTNLGRGLGILAGILLVVLAFYLEYSNRFSRKEPVSPPSQRVRAQDFLYVRDDDPSDNFRALIHESWRISILARTGVNLLSQYHKDLVKHTAQIRLIVVDPKAPGAEFVYGSNPEIYTQNIETTACHLAALKKELGERLETRRINHAPTMSVMIFERKDVSRNLIRVQLYFLHSRTGSDRPVFRIESNDPWYRVFEDEFQALFTKGLSWEYEREKAPLRL